MIRFEDVAVVYGDHRAVDGIDLEIADGEFFTLLGPSGCGKTTALRALAGFVTPTSGRILVDGVDVTHLPSERRGVGMVFQNYALFPTMNVRENIEFGLRVQKRSADERRRRVDEVADRTGLTAQQLERNVSELSGGQQQRVAIARALVLEPRILLLDEPLSNLDAKLRVQLREQLKQLQSDLGVTTVYVTHDQEEALTLSDRVAVLDAGRVEQVGTPEEVYDRSATRFVCRFIGASNELGPELRALLGAGDARTDAYLRPERIRMTSTTDGVPGTVLKRVYHGSYSRYTVRAADTLLAVDVPGTADEHWTPDSPVSLAVDRRWVLSYRAARP